MREIKTKSTIKDIKALDKAADVSRRAKNAYIRTKEQAGQTQQTEHDSYTEYAEDKIKAGAETVTREAGHSVERQGKTAVQKIKERRNARSDTSHANAADGYTAEQTSRLETGNSQAGNRSAASSRVKQTAPLKTKSVSEQYNVPAQARQPAQQKAAQSKAKETVRRKYTLSKPSELAKRRFVQSRAEARFTKNREIRAAETKTAQVIQNPVFRPSERITGRTVQPGMRGTGRAVRQSARSGSKAVKETVKGTIKTARKSIKTAGQTAKTGVKTSQAAAKAASETAQATAKATQRTAQAARAAARFTARMVKLTVKATAALVKGMITLVSTGGAVLSLFLIIIAVAALVSSPYGIFFSNGNKDSGVTPISHVVQDVNAEFAARIENIKDSHNNVNRMEIHYAGSANNIRVDNWMDVVAVFAVKTAMDENGMDVATIDTTRIALIKSVFWDMNLIDYYVETIEYSDGETTTYEHILHIIITSRTAEQQADEYGFTNDQKNIMEEILSGQFRPLMYDLLGMN